MKRRKLPNFSQQKRSFDCVLATYRNSQKHYGLGCRSLDATLGSSSSNAMKPNSSEFRCDVERTVQKLIPKQYLPWFWGAYIFDSVNPLEREIFVQNMLGDRRHSWEQRLGAKFIELKLYPPAEYFIHRRVQ